MRSSPLRLLKEHTFSKYFPSVGGNFFGVLVHATTTWFSSFSSNSSYPRLSFAGSSNAAVLALPGSSNASVQVLAERTSLRLPHAYKKKNTYISLLSMLFFGYRSKLVDIAFEEEKHYFEKYFLGLK